MLTSAALVGTLISYIHGCFLTLHCTILRHINSICHHFSHSPTALTIPWAASIVLCKTLSICGFISVPGGSLISTRASPALIGQARLFCVILLLPCRAGTGHMMEGDARAALEHSASPAMAPRRLDTDVLLSLHTYSAQTNWLSVTGLLML